MERDKGILRDAFKLRRPWRKSFFLLEEGSKKKFGEMKRNALPLCHISFFAFLHPFLLPSFIGVLLQSATRNRHRSIVQIFLSHFSELLFSFCISVPLSI